jgi:hypothetical protein
MKKVIILPAILLINLIGHGQTLNDSLILYLPFNGNANDVSGNNFNGDVNGAVLAPDRNGNSNSAYYFDANSYISIAENNLLNINPDGFTVSVWAKADVEKNMGKAISIGEIGQGGFGIRVSTNPDEASYLLYNSSSYTNYVRDEDYFESGVWNMFTITYENGIFSSYLNGVFLNQDTAECYATTGYDLLIGSGEGMFDDFKGWLDEVRIYKRALTDLEVANLSGLSGAVRAAELEPFAFSNFELQTLNPLKIDYKWNVWGSVNDEDSYIDVVENPIKSGSNNSEYVGRVVTFETGIEWNDYASKREYVVRGDHGTMYDKHQIMQWKMLFADSTVLKIDTFALDWMIINQIHGGCELYDGGACENLNHGDGGIAWGGGIFNDNLKSLYGKPNEYEFRYRAMPDSSKVHYTLDIGTWMTFTYEIFWTKSDTGYYRLWKNNELIGSADNIQTVCGCCIDDDNFIQFKTGMYNLWEDAEEDSLVSYFDDIELYIDPEKNGISISDICQECLSNGSTIAPNSKDNNTGSILLFPNPVKDNLFVKGETIPSNITIYSIDGRKMKYAENVNFVNISDFEKGIYIVLVNIQESFTTIKIIKD